MKIDKEKIRLITIFLGLFLLLIPLDSLQVFGKISILRIFAIIPIFLIVFYKKEFKVNKSIAYLMIFIVYIFIQIFYTIDISKTITSFTTYVMYFILIYFCTSIEYNKREIKFLNRMFAYSTIVAAISVLFWGIYEESRLTLQIGSNFKEDQNQFCGFFVAGTVYYIKNIIEKRKIIISLVLLSTFLFLALLTGSRGGLISILLAVITYLCLNSKNDKNKIKKIFLSVIIGIIVIVILNVLLNFMSPEMAKRFTIKSVEQSGGTGRTKIWGFYLNYFKESTLLRKTFGYGFGTIIELYTKLAHNNWIQLLIETGILGTFIYISLIITLLKYTYKKNNIFMFSILIGYIGLTMSLSLFSYKPIWGAILIILLKKKENILEQ